MQLSVETKDIEIGVRQSAVSLSIGIVAGVPIA